MSRGLHAEIPDPYRDPNHYTRTDTPAPARDALSQLNRHLQPGQSLPTTDPGVYVDMGDLMSQTAAIIHNEQLNPLERILGMAVRSLASEVAALRQTDRIQVPGIVGLQLQVAGETAVPGNASPNPLQDYAILLQATLSQLTDGHK